MVESGSASAILLGCFVAVVSSAIQSFGITLQRKSHLLPVHLSEETDHDLHLQNIRIKRNMWLFGFFLFIVSNVLGSLIQITTLPLIILSPLQSIGLIFNSLLSCLLLPGETFTWKLGVGTFIIAIGAFIIAYNGNAVPPPPDKDADANERFKIIMAKLADARFLAWFIGTFVIIGLLLLANFAITYRRTTLKKKNECRQSKLIIRILDQMKFVKGVNYGLISGTLTAHTFLFAKSLIDVIFETIMSGDHDISHITKNLTPYFLLIVMLAIVGFQLTAFNLGLAQISTSILYPLCFLVYNLMNLINDLTFNHLIENKRMGWGQLAWVIVGLFGVLFGVVLISWDSAFGTPINRFPSLDNEDDYILQLKFPYTDVNETTKLVEDSPTFEEPNSYLSASSSDFLNPNSITLPKSSKTNGKRVLSYEQQQLLQQLNF